MKITTALKKRGRAVSRLVDLHRRARTFGIISTDMYKEYSELKKDMGKVPYWVIAYLDGYRDALTAEDYWHHLDFRYIMDDDVMVSTHRDSDIYYEKLGYKPGDLSDRPHGHYWAKTNRRYSSED